MLHGINCRFTDLPEAGWGMETVICVDGRANAAAGWRVPIRGKTTISPVRQTDELHATNGTDEGAVFSGRSGDKE
ncbi:hypothetical protein MXD63_40630, partial [Frankia sp. Cpl3]|nr:hypothetical protein [Frankia sp. Cpl3]